MLRRRWRDLLQSAGPGRAEHARRLVALGDEVGSGRRNGATVFVSGDESDGREALLRAVAAELRDGDAIVVAGRFELGELRAVGEDEAEAARAARARCNCCRPSCRSPRPMLPVLKLFSLVLRQSAKAWQIVSQIRDRNGQIDPGLLLPQLLQLAAQDRPVVCLVDCAEDAAAGWWEDLLTLFAGEIAGPVPVLLVVGVEAETRRDDVPRGQYAAQTLVQRGLARVWPLERIGHDGPRGVGRDAPSRRSSRRCSTAAAAGTAHWPPACGRRGGPAGVVERDARRPAVALQRGWSGRDRRGTAAARRGVSLPELERAREVLSVAALEGRQFTAEAVAHALERERDELVDYLDDVLVEAELVEEVGLITIESEQGTQHLWRYRFVSDLDRLTLRHALTGREAADRSERLAERARRGLRRRQRRRLRHGRAALRCRRRRGAWPPASGPGRGSAWTTTSSSGARRGCCRARRRSAPLERDDGGGGARRGGAAALSTGPFTEGLAYAQAALRHALEGSEPGRGVLLRGLVRGQPASSTPRPAGISRRRWPRADAAPGTRADRRRDCTGSPTSTSREGDYATAQRRYAEVLSVRRAARRPRRRGRGARRLSGADQRTGSLTRRQAGDLPWRRADRDHSRRVTRGFGRLGADGTITVFRFQRPRPALCGGRSSGARRTARAGAGRTSSEALSITRSLGDADGEREILELIAAQGET